LLFFIGENLPKIKKIKNLVLKSLLGMIANLAAKKVPKMSTGL
jgi:hypothetical protein